MKPSRRCFQYSLRSFLVVLTASAVWLGVVVNRAREQREAVKAIETLGGIVTYDWDHEQYGIIFPPADFPKEPSGPAWLRRLIGDEYFQEVKRVRFPSANYYPSTPEPIMCIPYLRRLRGLGHIALWPPPQISKDVQSELQRALPNCEILVFRGKWDYIEFIDSIE